MTKLGRFILAIIIILIGIGALALGVFLLAQSRQWVVVGFAVALTLFGVATIFGGWAITRGERIRDILEALFLGLP